MKYSSPLGVYTVTADAENITGIWLEGQKYFPKSIDKYIPDDKQAVFKIVSAWLDRYFSGENPGNIPPVLPEGTVFQKKVWRHLLGIPYGETATYGAIAKKIAAEDSSAKTSARAVGSAVGRNPVSLLIPCHRVVGANGSMTGYAGGIDVKISLLALEKNER